MLQITVKYLIAAAVAGVKRMLVVDRGGEIAELSVLPDPLRIRIIMVLFRGNRADHFRLWRE